ncbi:hypothetical protein [Actinomadura rugatobispora]|uniref:Translation initiation factor IF-2 n=1 Tax=Actinomadura rugatobispora TaxID=1994 RepID=A0ABW1A727_9ACTN|nr:hypothetical protein GCM10010200_062710 [Actinomadura rugatobispora]
MPARHAQRPAPQAPAPLVPAWLPPSPPDRVPEDTASRTAVLPVADAAPVFVDASGRRARLVRRLGILASVGLLAYLAVIGLNLAMGADAPLTPWPSGSGATREPAGDGGKPGTHSPSGPAPAASSTVAPRSGASPSGGTTATRSASSSATPAPPSKTRGRAPATPPGQTRGKPKPNG